MIAVRPDIQALRALAVLAVLAFHAWPDLVSGGFTGVDVFFVISGFVITRSLLREREHHGRIAWLEFWKRRALRLLPASFTLVAVVLFLGLQLGSPSAERGLLRDALAAVFYVENWNLAARDASYFGRTAEPSLLQHFWSLSVEEQFYLLWPALLGLALHVRSRAARVTLLAACTLASLAWSVHAVSYFDTLSRAWEFGVGSILAFVPGAPSPRSVRWVAGSLGLALLADAILITSPATPFPGLGALPPVAGAALLLWLSSDARWLGARPVQWVGDLSYSLYLWHWPVFLFLGVPDTAEPTRVAAAFFTSFALAAASVRWIERPFRTPAARALPAPRVFGALTAASAVFVAVVFVLDARIEREVERGVRLQPLAARCLGAHLVLRDVDAGSCADAASVDTLVPALRGLSAATTLSDCWIEPHGELRTCHLGAQGSSRKIALFGDSHASMMAPAFDEATRELGLELDVLSGWDCRAEQNATSVCTARPAMVRQLREGGYALVVLINARAYAPPSDASIHAFLDELSGVKVAVIEDGPVIHKPAMRCLWAARGGVEQSEACRETGAQPVDRLAQVAVERGLHVERLVDVLCDASGCPLVLGRTIVYVDVTGSHFSAPFSGSLSGWARRFVERAL